MARRIERINDRFGQQLTVAPMLGNNLKRRQDLPSTLQRMTVYLIGRSFYEAASAV